MYVNYLAVIWLTGTLISFLLLFSRNVHHTRRGGKDVYTLPWAFRIFFMAAPLLFIGFALDLLYGPHAIKSPDWTSYMGIGMMIIPLGLLCWYFALYRVSTDDKAIYFAAFLTTTIPFGSITRVVQKQVPRSACSYIYSRGHWPTYITGYLPDYSDLMSSINNKAPQASWEM